MCVIPISASGLQFGEFRILWRVGGASESEVVAVGVGKASGPQGISYLGLGSSEAARNEFAVERYGVLTLKFERDAFAEFSGGWLNVVAIVRESLEHERGAAQFQPAPTQLLVDDPFMFHGEAEALEVETQGALHVGDSKKWDDLLDVTGGRSGGIHCGTSFNRFLVHLVNPSRVARDGQVTP